MRVLILNQFFYPDISATAQLMTDLAEDLAKSGVDVTVVASRSDYRGNTNFSATEVYKGVKIVRLRGSRFRRALVPRLMAYLSFYFLALCKLPFLPRQDAILVLTTPPLIGLVALVAKAFHRTRVLYLVEDLYPEVAIESGQLLPRAIPTRILDGLSKILFRCSDAVIAIGDCMRRKIVAKGVPESKVFVIPNWADGAALHSVPKQENSFVNENELNDKFTVVYSGNMGQVHDFHALMEVAARFAAEPDVVFLFIGGGSRRAEIEAFVVSHGLHNVRFLDYVPRDDLGNTLGASDVCVVNLADGFEGLVVPSKLYGVLAAGRAVIYTGPNESEAAHVVKNFSCGMVVQNDDVTGLERALRTLYRQPELRKQFGYNARTAFEKHFDRPIMTRRYLDLIREIVYERP